MPRFAIVTPKELREQRKPRRRETTFSQMMAEFGTWILAGDETLEGIISPNLSWSQKDRKDYRVGLGIEDLPNGKDDDGNASETVPDLQGFIRDGEDKSMRSIVRGINEHLFKSHGWWAELNLDEALDEKDKIGHYVTIYPSKDVYNQVKSGKIKDGSKLSETGEADADTDADESSDDDSQE